MSKEEELDHNNLQPLTLEKYMVKKEHTAIKELYEVGTPKKAIARLLGIDIKTVLSKMSVQERQKLETLLRRK